MSVDPVSLAITVALSAANAAMTASRKIEGQRLEDLTVTVADYGTPCNYFYGKRRFDGVPIIWAEKIREVKRKSKTKGGKYSDYTYFGTWAVEIADHEIGGVLRLWFDRQLVYDLTGAGPVTPFSIGYSQRSGKTGMRDVNINLAEHIRIYTGTETQMPDPRMQATVDAEFGAGSTPAYRGKSYIVFEDVPLEKFGNRIPQITIEAVATPSVVYPFETKPTVTSPPRRLFGFIYSPDRSRFIWNGGDNFEIFDVPTRSRMAYGNFPVEIDNAQAVLSISNDGRIFAVRGFTERVVRIFSETGFAHIGDILFPPRLEYCQVLSTGATEFVLVSTVLGDVPGIYYSAPNPGATVTEIAVSWFVTHYLKDDADNIWAVGASATDVEFYCVAGDRAGDTGTVTAASTGLKGVVHNGKGQFFVYTSAHFVLVADTTFAIDASVAAFATDTFNTLKQIINCPPGSPSIWFNNVEVSLVDLTTIRTVNLANWLAQDADGVIYDEINHALICAPQFVNVLTWRYLDRIGGATVTLASIVNDVAARAGIANTDIDVSALTQAIAGYNWSQGTGKDVVEPLLDLYDNDARAHGFGLQFVNRGSPAGPAIISDDFAMVDRGGDLYNFTRSGGSDLPRSISLVFADADADQQSNSALSVRPLDAVDGAREQTIDMNTLVLTPSEAKQLCDRYLRRRWFDRTGYSVPLSAQQITLEPAEVRTLTLPSGSVIARLTSIVFDADRSVSTEWVRDDPSVAVLNQAAGAPMDGREAEVIRIPGPTKGFILDVPLANDVHDGAVPFLYYAAAPFVTGYWPGADIAISDSGLLTDYQAGWAAVSAADAIDWGYATNAAGNSFPWVFDEASVLNVQMQRGILTSLTEAALLDSGTLNLALLGSEYIQYRTATLQADGSYDLTGLLRGLRGTEAMIAGHAAGDLFIPVSAQLFRREVGAGEIADLDAYRAVTQGRDVSGAFETVVTFSAAAHRPYSPVHGVLLRNVGSNDWTISATRRTRIGGANVDGSNVPLGEVSEAWQADVMDGAAVKRTLSGTTLPLTYTSAQQVTDWGANQTALNINLYQMSPALSLRGFPLNIAA